MRVKGSLWKGTRTATAIAKKETRTERQSTEDKHKAEARKRDKFRCRFPRCGCDKLKLRIEVSHDRHKGMGGNPKGDRSMPADLITMCLARHQDNLVSRHKGTLRTEFRQVQRRNNGAVIWLVDRKTLVKALPGLRLPSTQARRTWVEVAREFKVQQLEPLEPWQIEVLDRLAEMKT